MPMLPAFCDTCATVFPSGFFMEGVHGAISNCTSGPCPKCGGTGHVPDGVFNFIGNTIEVLSAPQRTVDELNRFVSILREAQQEQQSAEAIASRVQKDAPSFSKLIELLPKNRAELYGFVAVILAAAQLVTQPPQPSNTTVSVTVNQVIQQVFVQPPSPGDAALKAESKGRKVGRNEPCPCGSEKKYKKCCGAVK